jgi:ParB/RepB/Spo0J family partition protein
MPTDTTPTRKLRDLVAHEHNVRLDDSTDVEDLAYSIRSVGLLTPLTVQRNTCTIIAGHRRFRALSHLAEEGVYSWDYDVPVHEHELPTDSDEATAEMLVENMQRVDLTPIEEALGFERLKDLGFKQKEIADRIGKSASLVSQRLRLLKLPATVQGLVHVNKLDVVKAEKLVALCDDVEKMEYVVEAEGDVSEMTINRWLSQAEQEKILNRARKWITDAGGTPIESYPDVAALDKAINHQAQFDIDSADAASIAVAEGGEYLWIALRFDDTVSAYGLIEKKPEAAPASTPSESKVKEILEAKKKRNAVLAAVVPTAIMQKSWYEQLMLVFIVKNAGHRTLQLAARYIHVSAEEIGTNPLEYWLTAMDGNGVGAMRHRLAIVAANFELMHGGHNPPKEDDLITTVLSALDIELDELGCPMHYDELMEEGQTHDN